MRIFFMVVLCVAATCSLLASGTNSLFLTDDGFLRIDGAQKVEEAKNTRESLPAEQFPEGNWGPVTNGFQLSLRFEKTNFVSGEAIMAVLLLRNTSTNLLKYRIATVAGMDGPIGFVVSDAAGVISPISAGQITIISSSELALAPSTQRKYVEQLDKRFPLNKPGSYTVYARLGTGGPHCTEVKSGKVILVVRH
jgi:hypothetical protein